MLGLKVLVGVLTVLLIAGFGVLAGGLMMQAKRGGGDAGFGTAELTLPPGGKVMETAIQGDRVVLRVALPDGEERLHVFDVASGRAIGTIAVKRAP
ncbi:MAG: hypothetical protein IT563_17835 [Alphaproteobacteria bacterium]|nr:hypothetical protein [Alphaproteobacteria bacterium]